MTHHEYEKRAQLIYISSAPRPIQDKHLKELDGLYYNAHKTEIINTQAKKIIEESKSDILKDLSFT